jgi:hypothetical protein
MLLLIELEVVVETEVTEVVDVVDVVEDEDGAVIVDA